MVKAGSRGMNDEDIVNNIFKFEAVTGDCRGNTCPVHYKACQGDCIG